MAFSDLVTVVQRCQRHLLYETGGILSKEVTLPFTSRFEKPWLLFECKADPRYSFRCHELRLGPEGNPEAVYFDKKNVGFHGYVGRLYPTLGSLRGYMSDSDSWSRIGVHVRGGEAIECLSQERMMNDLYDELAAGMWTARHALDEKDRDERLIAMGLHCGEKTD